MSFQARPGLGKFVASDTRRLQCLGLLAKKCLSLALTPEKLDRDSLELTWARRAGRRPAATGTGGPYSNQANPIMNMMRGGGNFET
eukprot:246223-Hanusia_phi.AAC.1